MKSLPAALLSLGVVVSCCRSARAEYDYPGGERRNVAGVVATHPHTGVKP